MHLSYTGNGLHAILLLSECKTGEAVLVFKYTFLTTVSNLHQVPPDLTLKYDLSAYLGFVYFLQQISTTFLIITGQL
jgi:hypothetical protein